MSRAGAAFLIRVVAFAVSASSLAMMVAIIIGAVPSLPFSDFVMSFAPPRDGAVFAPLASWSGVFADRGVSSVAIGATGAVFSGLLVCASEIVRDGYAAFARRSAARRRAERIAHASLLRREAEERAKRKERKGCDSGAGSGFVIGMILGGIFM